MEKPQPLRSACQGSLRRLRLERIEIHLYRLHRIDAEVPAEGQLGTLKDLLELCLRQHGIHRATGRLHRRTGSDTVHEPQNLAEARSISSNLKVVLLNCHDRLSHEFLHVHPGTALGVRGDRIRSPFHRLQI